MKTLKQKFNEAIKVKWDFVNTLTDTEYSIYEDDKVIRVAFQGSTSKLDWLQNFRFFKKPYRNMPSLFLVHSGFISKYKSVHKDIIPKIKDAVMLHGKTVEIRGYSQGSALALLLHEDVVFHIGVHADTTVFGCPRVFSFMNHKELDLRMTGVLRVQNNNDIITKIPFIFLLFRHYGKHKNIGKDKRCIFKLKVKDHFKPNYNESLDHHS